MFRFGPSFGFSWVAGLLILSISTLAWSVDRDLQIADAYFAKRRSDAAARAVSRASALVRQPILERLIPEGFKPGQAWRVRLSITKPPLNSPEVRESKIAILRYSVLEWTGFDDAKLVIRVEAPALSPRGVFIEQRILFRGGRSEMRRCRQESSCSPWIAYDSQTLRLAGEDSGFGWEHGPVLLAADAVARASMVGDTARFESEDFFGRRSAWRWDAGDPWPALVESAQGRAELLKQGEEQ